MCKAGGPRCASHIKKELNMVLGAYSTAESDPNVSKAALKRLEKEVLEKTAEMDSTPTGQKALQKKIDDAEDGSKEQKDLKKRLNKAIILRAVEEEKGREFRERQAEFQRLEQEANEELHDNSFAVQYKRALVSTILDDGAIHQKEGHEPWGGPSGDYEAEEHFRQCGLLIAKNINESYTWREYDTFRSNDRVGVSADVTCNCGKHVNRRAVLPEQTMGSLLTKMLNKN